jgi:hypothetical protein
VSDVVKEDLELVQLNIDRYCRLLASETVPRKRRQILALLREAQSTEAKFLTFLRDRRIADRKEVHRRGDGGRWMTP